MNKDEIITINQHYVPCCVLKFFKESDYPLNKKHKRIFHVLHNRNQIYQSTIDKVMSGRFFYENSEIPINRVEKSLQKFESWYSNMHGKMIGLIREYEAGTVKFSIVRDNIFNLLEPMIRMHLRSGAIMYELNYWQERNRPNYSLFRMLDRLLQRNYSYDFAYTLIKFYDLCILKSNNGNFIISDQFISIASLSFKARFMNATNRTVGLKDVIILLPLSKHYYICFYNGNKPSFIRSNQIKQLTLEQTEELNVVIMNNSYMQTAGPSFEILNRALTHYNDEGPTAVYYGGGRFNGGAELRKEVFYYEKDRLIYEFVTTLDYRRYMNVGKNESCPCNSGKTFGECCRYKVREFDRFMDRLKIQDENKHYDPYGIPDCHFREQNIFEYHSQNRQKN